MSDYPFSIFKRFHQNKYNKHIFLSVCFAIKTCAMLKEGLEDIKRVIRICKSEGQTTQWPNDKGS
jgi:hypothetical protein